jgi:hypothetical protein
VPGTNVAGELRNRIRAIGRNIGYYYFMFPGSIYIYNVKSGGTNTYIAYFRESVEYVSCHESFVYQDNYTEWQVVNPEKYKTQVINPVFGLGWWSEFPKDRLVIGLQILGSYCIEKYQVTLDSEYLNGNNKDISLDLNLYVGWHFSEQLMAGVGVMGENRMTAGSDWKVDIFNTHSKVGPMALVRYDFAENFYVSLQGGYGLLNLGGLNKDRDTLKPMGDNSYYAVDSKLKTLTVSLGVGTSF